VGHGQPKSTATGSQTPPVPLSRGHGRSDLAYFGKQQPTPKSMEEIAVDVTPQLGQTGGALENRSTTWDIEHEDGILPSDSSSLTCGTTVVIDTGGIWNLQERIQQSLQVVVDPCGKPRCLTRGPDQCSCSSPRVASRFFSKRVSCSSLRGDTPRMSTPDRGDPPNLESVDPTLEGYPDHLRPDVGWDDSSVQETDSFLGDYCGTHLSPLAGACTRSS